MTPDIYVIMLVAASIGALVGAAAVWIAQRLHVRRILRTWQAGEREVRS